MQNVATSFLHLLEGGSSSDVLAKVVLKAVTSENPSLVFSWEGCRNVDGW